MCVLQNSETAASHMGRGGVKGRHSHGDSHWRHWQHIAWSERPQRLCQQLKQNGAGQSRNGNGERRRCEKSRKHLEFALWTWGRRHLGVGGSGALVHPFEILFPLHVHRAAHDVLLGLTGGTDKEREKVRRKRFVACVRPIHYAFHGWNEKGIFASIEQRSCKP